jgi:ABC-type antimicrobial peptide transport system permease subunit
VLPRIPREQPQEETYSVNQRQKEIAIRLALGASARDVQLRIMRQTLTLAALGLLMGVPASCSWTVR